MDKKQQSLTSFFKPKAATSLPQIPRKPPASSVTEEQPNPIQDGSESSPEPQSGPRRRKRPLQEDADRANGAGPKKQRSKAGDVTSCTAPAPEPSPAADLDDDDDAAVRERSSYFGGFRSGSSAPAAGPRSSSPAPSPAGTSTKQQNKTAAAAVRTSRYAYDPSSSASAAVEEGDAGTPEDAERERRRKEDLHRRFVKKLGHPDAMAHMKRRNRNIDEETAALDGEGAGEDDAEGGEEDEEETPPPTKSKKGGKTKLTPMEIQFLDIKRKHMDTILIVEVGYKFRFFGEDARIAAKTLSIVCIPGKLRYDEHPSEAHLDRFASASIPVHRLSVHVKRLVAAGHKVGVVRQIETAALKKVGDNRNAPFVRKLTNIYTKGTYVDELGELDQPGSSGGAPSAGYLLCMTESKTKGSGTDERVAVGIVAVQPATGDIVYDSFEDGFMRSEVETRLLHISPCEFLIVGELSKGTEKLVQHLSCSSTNVFGDRSRVERVPRSKTMGTEAYSHVTQFYAGKMKDAKNDDGRSSEMLEKILKLPEPVMICLSAMINHLTEYGLENIFDLTKYFQSFTERTHMLINGTTLESLEVYRNQTDLTETGSLFWAVDKTQTRFGQRLLRKWIGRPLLDQQTIEERLSAVEELLQGRGTAKVDKLASLLSATKSDLERSLIRIYYGKCTRPELLSVLQTLQRIATEYTLVRTPEDTGFRSSLLSSAVLSLPAIRETVVTYLDQINPVAARKDDKYEFFRDDDADDAISNHKLGIGAVEQELDAHRRDAAAKLGRKQPVNYVTVAGIEYLIEVANSDLKRVPASWIKMSGTKKVSRFHTPEVVRLIAERDRHRESLAAACDAAFARMLADIAAHYQPLRDAVAALATLDCLLSLSRVAALPGYSRPTFLDPASTPGSTIRVVDGRHPMAEHLLTSRGEGDGSGYIPFSTSLSAPAPISQLITGPNMGGKSSYVRAVALLVLLAQVGSFVPASSLELTACDAIFTRMGARDNLAAGESTFMVEVSETSAILRAATPRSLVVLDELGRGTSTHDGAAIAAAVLEHVVREVKCLTLFITHYQNLARLADGLGDGMVRCVHMRFESNKSKTNDSGQAGDDTGDEEITFLYEVADGVAHRSYGLNVARLARLPRRVLDVAAAKSAELERDVRSRRLGAAAALLKRVVGEGGKGGALSIDPADDPLDHLIASIEQL